ncbi:MAG TPA: helix-turn-helix domain-containing protein [Nitrospiraceae bacterium]|nr:helix-turn-helix domain-containing protein [Nitrospiraceae bacterium]
MRRKRPSGMLSTAQVARVLGVTTKTLYRMLKDGRAPEPPRNVENNYRVWAPNEVQQLQEELSS